MEASSGWLLRDSEVLAAVDVAGILAERVRGLRGRHGYDGGLLLPKSKSAHSLGMRFPIDVAFLDADLVVLDVCVLPPWRITRPRWRARQVLEAEAGAFERWTLRPGDHLELRALE
jgi:uncharacterized protein